METQLIYSINFGANPPIIIYSMHRVGSTTVYKSLKNADMPNPIYKVHFLSDDGIKKAEELLIGLKNPQVPDHIELSKKLRKEMDRTKDVQRKIITLAREPISREVSFFFHRVSRFHPELVDGNGQIKKDRAIKSLQMKFMFFNESTNDTCSWFDYEFKRMFNIDVCAYPFDRRKGFTIISNKNVKVLILRLEDLNHRFNNALTEFLGLSFPIRVLKSNTREDMRRGVVYRKVLEEITFPKSICSRIYSSKYATHFYSENERDQFIQRWSRE